MWSNAYLAIPFIAGGRTRAGCDCYGLVRLVLQEQFGKAMPEYAGAYSSLDPQEIEPVADAIREGIRTEEIGEAEAGAVAMVALRGAEVHCGVFVDRFHLLHTDSKTGPVVEDVRRPRLAGRIKGIYRVR